MKPFLCLFLMYGIKTKVCREEERFKIRFVHIDNLKNLFHIRRIDRIPNTGYRARRGCMKGL